MFASYSRLPPTTPPSSLYADGVSIVSASDSAFYDSMYDEDILNSASCQMYQPSSDHASSSSYTLPPLAPPSLHPVPSPFVPYVPPPQQHSIAPPYPMPHSTLDLSTPALDLDVDGEIPGRVEMDMGMAQSGSESALAGIQTPLAAYAAQMAVWLWHGQHPPPPPTSVNNSPLLNSPNPFDVPHSVSPLNPLQVAPSPEFVIFVERILRVTMVSHSVTLIALLYIYRLKQKNIIVGDAGSETRPFVVSLILGNKYLDDNTYTNATWAELAGLDLKDLNKMEKEFLKGLDYRLTVDRSDYQHWRNLLDGFIYARKREAAHAANVHRHRPSWSPQTVIYTPVPTGVPTLPTDAYGRARSASPAQFYSTEHADNTYLYNAASPLRQKRSAVDAFAADIPDQSVVYEQMRLPMRKAQFGSMDASYAPLEESSSSSSSGGLGRSSSLNRRIARLPGDMGRRGSVGQIQGAQALEEPDLRHAAAMHLQQQEGYVPQWQGYTSLIAPYEAAAQMNQVPPEHLMFYALAAAPHPGFDGAPRKAILRYQHPTQRPYNYPTQPAPTPIHPLYSETTPSTEYPYQPTYAVPQPAQFANAGPPGYAYAPSQGPTRTGLGISGLHSVHGATQYTPVGLPQQQIYAPVEDQQMTEIQPYAMDAGRARSQWSSPFAGHFDPYVWQQPPQ